MTLYIFWGVVLCCFNGTLLLGEGKFFNGKKIRSEIGKGNVPNAVQ